MAYILYQCHQKVPVSISWHKPWLQFWWQTENVQCTYPVYVNSTNVRYCMWDICIYMYVYIYIYIYICMYVCMYVCYVYSTYVSYSTISLNTRLHLSTCLSNCEVIIENKVYNNGPFFHRKLGCILDLFYLFVCPFTLLENWLNVVHSPSVKFKIDLHNSSVQNTFTKKKTSIIEIHVK